MNRYKSILPDSNHGIESFGKIQKTLKIQFFFFFKINFSLSEKSILFKFETRPNKLRAHGIHSMLVYILSGLQKTGQSCLHSHVITEKKKKQREKLILLNKVSKNLYFFQIIFIFSKLYLDSHGAIQICVSRVFLEND